MSSDTQDPGNVKRMFREQAADIITHAYMAGNVDDSLQDVLDEALATLERLHVAGVRGELDRVRREVPDDDIVTTKYGYHSDEKKYGYRIAMAELRVVLDRLGKDTI